MRFVAKVARHLYQEYQGDISEFAIIFPNKRPAVYFRQELGKLIDQPIWSPDIFTIHEFIQQSTTQLPADRLLCSFLLYEAYDEIMSVVTGSVVSYERFYPLGEILLNDFTELESNVISISDLYTNMAELAALDQRVDYLTDEQLNYLKGFWKNFSLHRISQQKERFLQLWKNLPAIFESFREKLKSRGLITTGMVYRSLVAGDYEKQDFLSQWRKLVFVGFNALNRAELQFLQKWQEEGRAIFYFDTDEHYINDPLQEAGRFLRRNLGLFKNQLPTENAINRSERPVHVIRAEGNAAQVRLIPALLEELPGVRESPEDTAILLSDENQLMPVLHALPDWVDTVNITMGYGLKQSPLYSLIDKLVAIQESLQKTEGRAVYFQPLLQLVQHPYLYRLKDSEMLAEKIQQQSLLNIDSSHWAEITEPILKKALSPVQEPMELFQTVREILELQMQAAPTLNLGSIDAELITAAYLQLNRLEDLLRGVNQELSLGFVGEILLQVLQSLTVPLEGEPLKGLQIMGLLESRALDFKNLILLNVNEGVLPKKAVAPTFIPDSIRRAFGLSVIENQDSIFAYVFYRLLQRSERVYCLYNITVDEKGAAEQSRFLTQLEYETNIPIIRKNIHIDLHSKAKDPIVIRKDETVMKSLRGYRSEKKMLSPSAINTYLECRLQFYFRQVQGIKEPDEIAEEIAPNILGNMLHRSIEFLYNALAEKKSNNLVEPEDIDWLHTQVDQYICEAFAQELAQDRKQTIDYTGTLRVVEEVVRTYVKEILKQDKRYAPFHLVAQEARITRPYRFEVNGESWTIYLGGFIDRVDFKDGVYRIIDYKTGGDKKDFRNLESLFERDRGDRNKAALQTIIYSDLLRQELEHPGLTPILKRIDSPGAPLNIAAGLYDVRSMRKDGDEFDWRFQNLSTKSRLDHYLMPEAGQTAMTLLGQTIEEIFDPNQVFDQTSRQEKCEYCPYQVICGR